MRAASVETSGRKADERGATLVLFALLAVVLLTFVAFAVDLGPVYNARRQAQTAADAASLGGALEIVRGQATGDPAAVVGALEASARDLTGRNLDDALDWGGCRDDDRPAGYVPSADTDCVSFTPGLDVVRVRVPSLNVSLNFARAVGLESFEVSASAEAAVDALGGRGVPPLAVLGPDGVSGREVCLRAQPPPAAASGVPEENCGDPALPPLVPFRPMYYREGCLPGDDAPEGLARALADGLDHLLGLWPTYGGQSDAGTLNGGGDCQPALPSTLEPPTPTAASDFRPVIAQGMVTGGNHAGKTFTARLGATSGDGGGGGGGDLAGYLQAEVGSGCRADLVACLSGWSPGVGRLFDDAIAKSPRLATVPVVHETAAVADPAGRYHVAGFVPVFFNQLYPGPSGSPASSARAVVLDCGMFSRRLCRDDQPNATGGSHDQLFNVALSR